MNMDETEHLDQFLNGLAIKPSVSSEEEQEIREQIDKAMQKGVNGIGVLVLLDKVLELEHREEVANE